MTLIRLFLPLIIIFHIYPVGSVFEYNLFTSHYTLTMTTAIVLDNPEVGNQVLITSYSATNLGEDVYHVGPASFRAYDKITENLLTYQPCLDEFDERIVPEATATGSLCWVGEIGSEGTVVVYSHSIFERNSFAWGNSR